MNKLIFSLCFVLTAYAAGASALENSPLIRHSPYGTGFGAPTISGKDNVSPKSEGDMVYDSLDGIFFGYDGTNWNALSVGVESGTSSYHSPTTGQIVYDTAATAFKGYNGTSWLTFSAASSVSVTGFRYTNATARGYTGFNPIQYDTSVSDPSSMITTGASWHATVPASHGGLWMICASFNSSDQSSGAFYLYVNGSQSALITDHTDGGSNVKSRINGCIPYILSASDTFDVRYSTSVTQTASTLINWISAYGPIY
jgi:hypothetical protein